MLFPPVCSHLSTREPAHLQGERQPDEVHHHLLVGQLHAEQGQQVVEVLVVLPPAALLLAAQVDVAVELLAVLQGVGGERRFRETERVTCSVLVLLGLGTAVDKTEDIFLKHLSNGKWTTFIECFSNQLATQSTYTI